VLRPYWPPRPPNLTQEVHSSMNASMSDDQSFCIFCGGTPLPREHIWADWLRAYISKNLPYYHSGRAI
jgi:hypothetical protein